MKSAGSCFPNCPDFLQDLCILSNGLFPFKTVLPPFSFLYHHLFFFFVVTYFGVALFFFDTHIYFFFFAIMGMATDAQFHVLAVDDSLIDRKLIERLLKTSSCHGKFIFIIFSCQFNSDIKLKYKVF